MDSTTQPTVECQRASIRKSITKQSLESITDIVLEEQWSFLLLRAQGKSPGENIWQCLHTSLHPNQSNTGYNRCLSTEMLKTFAFGWFQEGCIKLCDEVTSMVEIEVDHTKISEWPLKKSKWELKMKVCLK